MGHAGRSKVVYLESLGSLPEGRSGHRRCWQTVSCWHHFILYLCCEFEFFCNMLSVLWDMVKNMCMWLGSQYGQEMCAGAAYAREQQARLFVRRCMLVCVHSSNSTLRTVGYQVRHADTERAANWAASGLVENLGQRYSTQHSCYTTRHLATILLHKLRNTVTAAATSTCGMARQNCAGC